METPNAEDLSTTIRVVEESTKDIVLLETVNRADNYVAEPDCVPVLPAGKNYHVYFLYRTVSPDKDWVLDVVKRLETGQSGFKCGYHERDFMPGQTIIQNIENALRQSLKVIIVISPEFLDSAWTKRETEIATFLSLQQTTAQLSLIPVLLRDCEVPDSLKSLTYLDAQGEQSRWWPKLLRAITNTGGLQFSIRKRFSGRTGNDKAIPWLLHIVFNPKHDLIVTDGRNKALKKYSVEGKLMSQLTFDTRPDGITLSDGFNVTVTFPYTSLLKVVNTQTELSVVSTIHVEVGCSGITTTKDGQLLICNWKNGCLYKCSTDGTILQQIKTDSSGEQMFTNPTHVSVASDDKIYLCDMDTQYLFTIVTKDETQVLSTKRAFTNPRATCIVDGTLFLAASTIRVFTLDGKDAGEHVLEGVYHPRGLAFSEEKRLLAVTHKGDGDEKISVYRLSNT